MPETPVMVETAIVCQEVQEEADEVSPDRPYTGDGTSTAMTSSGELAAAPGMYTLIPTWPWASGGQLNHALYTQCNSQSVELPSTAWPCSGP